MIYEVASDDAGESRPAYMGEKESVYPVQSEVSALDLYITNFVWPPGPTGGLQRKTNETYSYGVYGIDDWHQSARVRHLSLGRTYDYPHIVDMWLSMYKVAKYNPQITTAWAATNYLEAAWGTALALYTVAGAGHSTPGLMSEVVFPDLLDALQNEGMTNQYDSTAPLLGIQGCLLRHRQSEPVRVRIRLRLDRVRSDRGLRQIRHDARRFGRRHGLGQSVSVPPGDEQLHVHGGDGQYV